MLRNGFTVGPAPLFGAGSVMETLEAAVYLANGAILIDEYDPQILDDVRRESILWNRVDKRLAPGETTGGFDQTAIATATARPRRNLGFSSSGPTRTQRTPKTVKAIAADTTFGIFDRSVYQQQGRRFGNLEQKDVQDLKSSCIRAWASLAYIGNTGSSDDEFDGLRTLLGAGTTIADDASILNGFNEKLISMTNTSAIVVRPSAIYTNAMVTYMLNQELLLIGDKLLYAPIKVGDSVFDTPQIATPVGYLPLIADPFNTVIAGTPNAYPSFIVEERMLSWQYVEVLGAPGAEPQTYEISLTNALDLQYKTLMFGALELLQSANHHARVNVEYRSVTVNPVATA